MAKIYINTPISKEKIEKLKIGDTLYLTGDIILMRDEAHKRALEYFNEGIKLPFDIENLALFHCGPIVKEENGNYQVISAGPTTSMRMEPFEADMIKNYHIRVIIGKGGMGKDTIEAMKKEKAIFTAFTGGAGVLLPANSIKKVKGAYWLDLGTPEAFWVFKVENFGPLTVAIDSNGNSLYTELEKEIEINKEKAYKFLSI